MTLSQCMQYEAVKSQLYKYLPFLFIAFATFFKVTMIFFYYGHFGKRNKLN